MALSAIVPVLARIGYYGGIVEGGRYVWRVASKHLGGTKAAPILAGAETLVRDIGREFGPLDPFKLLDESGAFAVSGPAPAKESEVLRDCNRAATLRADQLSLNVGGADVSVPGIRSAAKRRFAQLSESFSKLALAKHRLSPDSPEALRLAGQGLAFAELSLAPPEDPRLLLTSDMSPSGQSALTDVIDHCNRKEEPDLKLLTNRVLSAFNGYTLSGSPAKNVGCCDACAKKAGPCKGGSCGLPAKPAEPGTLKADTTAKDGDSLHNEFLFGPRGEDPNADFEDDEDDDDDLLGEDGAIAGLEAVTRGLNKRSCMSGGCNK